MSKENKMEFFKKAAKDPTLEKKLLDEEAAGVQGGDGGVRGPYGYYFETPLPQPPFYPSTSPLSDENQREKEADLK